MTWGTRRVWPPQLVEVLDNDRWRRAQLEAWKRSDAGVQAYVRYCAEPGYALTDFAWVDRTRVRMRKASELVRRRDS